MRVRDLGALVVDDGARDTPVAGMRAPAILAMLLLHVNRRVPVAALMEAAWGDHPSSGAASTLASHIWRLRQLLEPDRRPGASPTVLLNDDDGYRLVGSPATVDSLLFAEAAAEVRELLAAGQGREAVRRADAALALWRGRPYGASADEMWARSGVSRLEEIRAQLEERRIEGLLASGDTDAALADLQPMIAAMPFHEPLRVLQMDALQRSGRREEALRAFQEARSTLLEEVGIEPGAELQALHQRVLRDDLPSAPRGERPSEGARPVEVHLPSALTPLVGRGDVVERLSGLVRSHGLVTVTGPAGCGKTRVAVETARAVASGFPDGVWFVDLTAVADPGLVVGAVVSAIGFAASPDATPLQDLSRYLHSRRLLLVLDNCEHVLTSVDEIVRAAFAESGGGPACCILTTSREPIGIEGETIWTLEPLGLPGQGPAGAVAPAVDLFLQRLAEADPGVVVDEEVLARAAEITIAVDGLPLAIELAAARALSHSLTDIAAQVTDDPGRLRRAGRTRRDHHATVRSAIEWSHRLLDPVEQTVHRRLSVLPGAFTASLAGAVVGPVDHDTDDIDDLLARLVHRSLVTSDGSARPGSPTRFRQLATVRSHARHALEDAGETLMCLDRRDAWTGALLAARPSLGAGAEVAWDRAVDDDDATVRATLARRLIDEPSVDGARLAPALTFYWYYRERLAEADRWLRLGHEVAVRVGAGEVDELLARLALASAHVLRRRLDLAMPLLEGVEARVLDGPAARRLDVGEAVAGVATAAYTSEAYEVLALIDPLLQQVATRLADRDFSLLGDAIHCCALLVTGQEGSAVALAMAVQARADDSGHLAAGFISTAPLIITALREHRPADGIGWIDRCAALQLRLGSGAIGMFAETKADFLAQLGRFREATTVYAAARAATRRAAMRWPNREQSRPLLELTRERLGRAGFEQAWQEGERLDVAQLF